jgi:type II secretory pathway component PulF
VLLLPLPRLVLTMNVGPYLATVLGVLLPVYAIVLGCSWALNADRQGQGAAALEAIIHRIPILGKARRSLAVARLSSALEGLIAAGMSIHQAWELAAKTCGSPALQRAVARWKPLFENGVTPAEALRNTPEFPDVFVKLYETAEITGSLDDAMRRTRTYFQEEGARRMEALATWVPRIIYLMLVLAVAWHVIQAWAGHYNAIVDLPF